MSIIWTILIGLIVGAIAKFIMHGAGPSGCIPTALLGIGGSFVATYLGSWLGWYHQGQAAGFLASLVGALLLLLVYKFIVKK